MSEIKEEKWELFSPEETFLLAEKMGQEAGPGEVYALVGDLGAGKTLFAQGFAAGLGITEHICSPTFTILQIYEEGRLPLYHFDVYRIEDPEEMFETGYEDYFYGDGVCLIEWADLIDDLLPEEYTAIQISRDPGRGDSFRRLSISRSVR